MCRVGDCTFEAFGDLSDPGASFSWLWLESWRVDMYLSGRKVPSVSRAGVKDMVLDVE